MEHRRRVTCFPSSRSGGTLCDATQRLRPDPAFRPDRGSPGLASASPGDAGGAAPRAKLTLAAGLLAGLAAWLGGEASLDLIKPPRHSVNSKGVVLNITDRREVAAANAKNAGLAFSLLALRWGSHWAWPAVFPADYPERPLRRRFWAWRLEGRGVLGCPWCCCPFTTNTRQDTQTRPPGT